MHHRDASRHRSRGLPWLVALILLLVPSLALAGDPVSGVPGTESPPATGEARPTEEPGATGEAGGVVPPTEQPRPTEIANEGVAPGWVVVIVAAADGGMIPAGTTACVGDVCQTLPSPVSSGFKWEFPRIAEGWHEVRVRGAEPYGGAVESVQVVQGQGTTVQVQLALPERPQEQPAQQPAGDPPPVTRDEATSAPRDGTTSDATTDPAGTSRFAAVTDLPVTGAGSHGPVLVTIALGFASFITLLLAVAVRRLQPRP
jgi:hypothetical protein